MCLYSNRSSRSGSGTRSANITGTREIVIVLSYEEQK